MSAVPTTGRRGDGVRPIGVRTFACFLTCLVLLLTACAPQRTADPTSPLDVVQSQPAPKHLVAALLKPNVPTIRENGADRTYEFILGGLARLDIWGVTHPQLAEAVPSVENG